MGGSVSFQAPRRLRAFSFDPTTGNRHANRRIREITISIPWELDPEVTIGPDGEYLQMIDYDPASGFFYEPLDIGHDQMRASDGLKPSEENPQFHQQMAYAVCMNTIAVFEQVLGRRVLWSERPYDEVREEVKNVSRGPARKKAEIRKAFVQKLRIYPHALREANAYYDPSKKALLFGYFTAPPTSTSAPPNSTVFTCLSHDILVHEMCHAILDGMHPRFIENSNRDMLALHEAFADIVAIFQHFSHPEVLEDQIMRTRGDLEKQSLLGALAQEFGQALGYNGALRDALGQTVDGEWQPREPDNQILESLHSPHARGAVLFAAVFRAFLSIYRSRVTDLFRIASGGSGILREGEIDPDLSKRLAGEAAKSARHILRMCIRAMDYVPPVDVDFGDFLRAIITADHDLYPEDEHGYRMAIIEAFSAWGIFAEDVPVITERALLWPSREDIVADMSKHTIGPRTDMSKQKIGSFEGEFGALVTDPDSIAADLREKIKLANWRSPRSFEINLKILRDFIREGLSDQINKSIQNKKKGHRPKRLSEQDVLNRSLLANEFENSRKVTHLARSFYGLLFWGIFNTASDPELNAILGITLSPEAKRSIRHSTNTGLPSLQLNSVRMASRIGKHGQKESEYVVELVQSREGYFDPEVQEALDNDGRVAARRAWRRLHPNRDMSPDFIHRSGATLLIDSKSFEIRRVIRTKHSIDDDAGLDRVRHYLSDRGQHAVNAFDDPAKPSETRNAFADLHRNVQRGIF